MGLHWFFKRTGRLSLVSFLFSMAFWGWALGAGGAGLEDALPHYLKIQADLAGDSIASLPTEAESLGAAAKKIKGPEGVKVLASAQTLAKANDIKAARQEFKKLSAIFSKWAAENHPKGMEVYNCSMANAKWVQVAGDTRNPYYGKEMLECGEKQ